MKRLSLRRTLEVLTIVVILSIAVILGQGSTCKKLIGVNESLLEVIDSERVDFLESVESSNKKYLELLEDCNTLMEECNRLNARVLTLERENTLLIEENTALEQGGVKISMYEFKDNELEELMKCVQAEAGEGNFKAQRMITQVIMNRVKSRYFPNSVHDVIFQEGQFAVTVDGNMKRQIVTDETRMNVLETLVCGYDMPDSVQFFYADYVEENNWIRTLEVYDTVEGTVFSFSPKE